VKINAVALKNLNEDEIPALMRWAHGKGMALTLIEVMPMGDVGEGRLDQYVPLSLLRARLAREFTLTDLDGPTGTSPLCPRGRNRRQARLHHADDAQLLRILQPGAHHCTGNAAHLSRARRRLRLRKPLRASPDKSCSPPPSIARLAQAQGPRLHHRPPAQSPSVNRLMSRDRRLSLARHSSFCLTAYPRVNLSIFDDGGKAR